MQLHVSRDYVAQKEQLLPHKLILMKYFPVI